MDLQDRNYWPDLTYEQLKTLLELSRESQIIHNMMTARKVHLTEKEALTSAVIELAKLNKYLESKLIQTLSLLPNLIFTEKS